MLVIFCQINRHFVGLGLFSLEMASLYKRPLKGAFSIPRSHSQTPAKLVKADCMVRGNASASSCSQLKWPSKKPLNTQIKWQSHPCLGIVDIRRITALGGILKQWCLVCTLFPGQLKKISKIENNSALWRPAYGVQALPSCQPARGQLVWPSPCGDIVLFYIQE